MAKVLIGICPNGYRFIVPCLLTLVAVALSVVATFSCHFFRTDAGVFIHQDGVANFTDDNTGIIGRQQNNDTEFTAGLFTVQEIDDDGETGSCTWWDRDALDTTLKVARSACVLALGFSVFYMVMFAIISVWRLNEGCLRIFYKLSGCMFCLIGMMMVLTLVALLSDFCQDAEDCVLLRAGYSACVACLFWMVAGFMICCCTPVHHRERKEKPPKKVEDDNNDDDDEEEVVEETYDDPEEEASTTFVETNDKTEPDGTVVRITKKTVTHRNGRKTVTQKREIISTPVPPPPPEDDAESTTLVEHDEKKERDGTIVKLTTTTVTHRNGHKTVTQEKEIFHPTPPPPPPAPKKEEEEKPKEVQEKEITKPVVVTHGDHPDPPGERSDENLEEDIAASRQLSAKVQENTGVLGACSPALWCA
mmetsp:Transcript_27964/g.76942  ORF Transcript_27964/g.76942 Transcript_27964/m.76942 type:complete len:419 (+) Transcript_27964:101-1357(+)|eukprot:CAMPEP_0168737350 /NCGR_PEP_ID=MMETSP0724-20121128/10350_1 /TAXON_ID=265536 /ORGANISM="Amphiprora sp., Strain CCMP467" /LENGTH=418 /DNA_ID=CAMNT_0008784615 /DNA_START=45 /DNA_END=1301 /DNA_ORIENTATION=-